LHKIKGAGHGRSGDRTATMNYRRFLETMRGKVRLNYRHGLSDFEMKPKVAEARRLSQLVDTAKSREKSGRIYL
jgi:hypothetical protein